MKAAIYDTFQGPIRISDVKEPHIKPDSVILKVLATGICRSDWHGWQGHDPDITLPHVPGHELVGIIEVTGSHVSQFQRGDRVTVPFVCACGSCEQCHSNNHQVCDHQSQPGFTHWGSFAEYVAIDHADTNLVRLPPEIDNKTAASLGCRFITSYRAIVDQGKVHSGQFVAVHGCGGVGLSAIMIANALGAQTIAIDINDSNLNLAKQLGANMTINATTSTDIVAEIKSYTNGGVHVSLDALGSQTTCFNSIANLRKRGRHIQVGLMTGNHQYPKIPMDQVIAKELEIVGSHGMQSFRYAEMLDMILVGTLKPHKLIEKTVSLEESIDILCSMDTFENVGIVVIDSF